MQELNFCYWLQGYFELTDSKELDSNQVDIIKDHLKLVFNKVTPDRSIGYQPVDPSFIKRGYDPLNDQRTYCCDKNGFFNITPELKMDLPPGASC